MGDLPLVLKAVADSVSEQLRRRDRTKPFILVCDDSPAEGAMLMACLPSSYGSLYVQHPRVLLEALTQALRWDALRGVVIVLDNIFEYDGAIEEGWIIGPPEDFEINHQGELVHAELKRSVPKVPVILLTRQDPQNLLFIEKVTFLREAEARIVEAAMQAGWYDLIDARLVLNMCLRRHGRTSDELFDGFAVNHALTQLVPLRNREDFLAIVEGFVARATRDRSHQPMVISARQAMTQVADAVEATIKANELSDPFSPLFPGGQWEWLYQDLVDSRTEWQLYVNAMWDFSKINRMALHDWQHVEHVYRIVAHLVGLLQQAQLLDPPLTAPELYALAGAAILHDSGNSGGRARTSDDRVVTLTDKHDVRKMHSLIIEYELKQESGELIGLDRWAQEAIGYLSLYHPSKPPLTGSTPVQMDTSRYQFEVRPCAPEKQYYMLSRKHRYEGRNCILRTQLLAGILRLADALDVDYMRAGVGLQHTVIRRQSQHEIEALLQELTVKLESDLVTDVRDVWDDMNPQSIVERLRIHEEQVVDPNDQMRLKELEYLCFQVQHFRKHLSLGEVQLSLEYQDGRPLLVATYPVRDPDQKWVLSVVEDDLKKEFASVQSIGVFEKLGPIVVRASH